MRGERLTDGLSVLTTGDGPPLVVLPGLGQGADLSVRVTRPTRWTAWSAAKGYRRTVHLINRPVAPPAGTSIATLAGWYARVLRDRFDGPVDVMGSSAGGITSLQLAMDHPDLVARLVVCVAASRVSDQGRRDMLRIVTLERQGRSAAWLASGLMGRGPLRLATFAGFVLARRTRRADGEVAVVEAVQEWDVTARLGEITAPTLVVAGDQDPLATPDLTAATAAGIPDARLVLLRGRGHVTATTDRRATAAIRNFLAAS